MRYGLINNLMGFSLEIIYAIIIIILCATIYSKTKELSELSGHKGIHYFRWTFLLLAVAHFFRLFAAFFFITGIHFGFPLHRYIMASTLLVTTYAGTAAILSLSLSMLWKKFKINNATLLINIISIVVALSVFFTRSLTVMMLLQFVILAAMFILLIQAFHKKTFTQMRLIYLLLILFWVLHIFALALPRFFPLVARIIVYLISIGILGVVTYKVHDVITKSREKLNGKKKRSS